MNPLRQAISSKQAMLGLINRSSFYFTTGGGINALGYSYDLIIVKIQTWYGVVGFWFLRFLFYGN